MELYILNGSACGIPVSTMTLIVVGRNGHVDFLRFLRASCFVVALPASSPAFGRHEQYPIGCGPARQLSRCKTGRPRAVCELAWHPCLSRAGSVAGHRRALVPWHAPNPLALALRALHVPGEPRQPECQ